MQELFIHPEGIVFSEQEVLYLMSIFGVKKILGTSIELSEESVPYQAIQQGWSLLLQRNLIGKNLENNDELANDLTKALTALFFPKEAIIIIRDIPDLGKQVLIFSRHSTTLILHTFPKEGSHRLAVFQDIEQVSGFVLDWFPIQKYPVASNHCLSIELEDFTRVRQYAETGDIDNALNLLSNYSFPDDEKRAMLDAIEHRAISGSFAWVRCELKAQEIVEADSFAMFADDRTAWVTLLSSSSSKELSVHQIGAGFPEFVKSFMRKLEPNN